MLEVIHCAPTGGAAAPHILFVHGGFHSAACWSHHLMPHLAANGLATSALSLRGHGGSEGRSGIDRWRLQDYVEDLRGVLALMREGTILAGHSMGGAIILKHFETAPHAPSLLMAPSPPKGFRTLLIAGALTNPRAFARAYRQKSLAPMTHLFESFFLKPDAAEETRQILRDQLGPESWAAIMDIAFHDRVKVTQLNAPTLILGGRHDVSIPRHMNRWLARTTGATFA